MRRRRCAQLHCMLSYAYAARVGVPHRLIRLHLLPEQSSARAIAPFNLDSLLLVHVGSKCAWDYDVQPHW